MNCRHGRPSLGRHGALFALAGLLLAGCANAALTPPAATDSEEAFFATSPANIASLTDVVVRNPNDPQAVNIRGAVFGQAGRYAEALADFNKAIGLDPNYAQAYANRGLIHRHSNKLDLALADYNKAIAIDAGYATAYLGRGQVQRLKGQLVPALQDFNKAIALRPDTAQAYYQRGLLYQGQRQHPFAIDDFSAALGLAPLQPEVLAARGLSYLAVNDLKAAAADLDEAVLRDQQNLHGWMSRALVYERLGQREKAAGSYAQAMRLRQDFAPARDGFARVGGKTGTAYKTFD